MAHRRRRADYVATLIYLDEPQLIALKSNTVNMLAIAVPDEDPNVARFLATTVSQTNWESYFDGNTDLRFLFTFPRQRLVYYFDLMEMVDGKIMLSPFTDAIPERDLPLARIFSSEHTSDFSIGDRSTEEETLLIDGEWNIPEFGDFYQRYTEIYAFSAAAKKWNDENTEDHLKRSIQTTFRDKPFKGGFSYLHFYKELTETLTRIERPQLESINYASPGSVHILGDEAHFRDVKSLIKRFLSHKVNIEEAYQDLRKYLQGLRFLQMAGDDFPQVFATPVRARAGALSAAMGLVEYDTIRDLANHNELVAAKILMSLNRRVLEAATFFAQGRMTFGS